MSSAHYCNKCTHSHLKNYLIRLYSFTVAAYNVKQQLATYVALYLLNEVVPHAHKNIKFEPLK